ncbi:metacaspase-2-like [Solenopsis invicta]|uniref:metacaspase-2-like n=1 Tax=Solenopsis invicta TaxID=13686 RepID=UPI00193CA56F|nr:metacaspase-2-like [Solenopsis invicta]
MINIYTKRRVLKPDAIPALAINSIIETETVNANAEIINIDINNDNCAMSYSNVSNVNNVNSINNVSNVSNINNISNVSNINNISNVSNVNNSNVNNTNVSNVAMENVQCIPNFMPILKKSIDHEEVRYLKNDIRRLKKHVNKKKKLIEKHAREKKKSRTNKWDSITEDLTKSQKIFFDII